MGDSQYSRMSMSHCRQHLTVPIYEGPRVRVGRYKHLIVVDHRYRSSRDDRFQVTEVEKQIVSAKPRQIKLFPQLPQKYPAALYIEDAPCLITQTVWGN